MAFNGTGANVTTLNAANISSGTLAVARGGTGITSAGTSGNVLTSNGTAWVSEAISAGGNYVRQIYNSPATWTKPAGLKAVSITVVAGGGGGGGTPSAGDFRAAGNGGVARAGSLFNYVSAPSIPGPVTVTVGAGGTPGPVTAPGGAGGTSSFGSFLSATGGGGGLTTTAPNQSAASGAIGGLTTGPALGVALYSGAGGDEGSVPSGFGYGINGIERFVPSPPPTPKNGTGIGSAGARGLYNSNNPGPDTGGAGAPGVVIVEEFY
jgi:hypothetical protein